MYLEVERGQSRAGWHVWLNHGRPSLGPSKGWDIGAETAEGVLEWLRALDVMWIDEEHHAACRGSSICGHGTSAGT